MQFFFAVFFFKRFMLASHSNRANPPHYAYNSLAVNALYVNAGNCQECGFLPYIVITLAGTFPASVSTWEGKSEETFQKLNSNNKNSFRLEL